MTLMMRMTMVVKMKATLIAMIFRNSPLGVGFHEPKFKKQWFFQRYPVAFHRIFVTSCLLAFFR